MNKRLRNTLFVAGLGIMTCGPSIAMEQTDRLIVKLRGQPSPEVTDTQIRRIAAGAGIEVHLRRQLDAATQVIHLPRSLPVAEARALASTLATDPEVEYAEPDVRRHAQLVPDDPQYVQQWYWYEDTAGLRMPAAWDIGTGSAGVVVAMVDSGIRPHAEFASRILPGYDFISDLWTANDGTGRDNDASDPGDWIDTTDATDACPATDSTWHGTSIAGLIGATGNNAIGIAGAGWQLGLLPVRVLGRCGGFISDIAAGVRWAAGLTVGDVPANANPADVINLSLGGPGDCSITEQAAIDAALAAGKVVVVAAGNESGDTADSSPANCTGVIVVAGITRAGTLGSYSNTGDEVTVSAPGGTGNDPLRSTSNSGSEGPVSDSYANLYGTSVATATVSGITALMLSENPALTAAQVRNQLQATARAFPDGSCNTSLCGAGIVDAGAALAAVSGVAVAPVADAGSDRLVTPGSLVTLNGSGSDDGSIVGFAWTQLSGTAVTLSNADSASARFTAPNDNATLVFRLTVTDDDGLRDSDSVTLTVTEASDDGGGGGGGSGDPALLLLLLLTAGRCRRRN